jgi:23S rRNA (cytosine1962-C5)-methyltransferase
VSATQVRGRVRLTGRGRRRLEGGHPWVFADDLAEQDAPPGALVAVEDPRGDVVGYGLYSSQSKIRVRVFLRGATPPSADHWRASLGRAIEARAKAGLFDPRGACRLLAGDADRVPGMVIDFYAGVCVLQSGAQGADGLRDELVAYLREAVAPTAIVERSDSAVRKLEGLERRVEVLHGELKGEVEVFENGLVYEVDVLGGHKTGHYLDQRDNRRRAARHARGGEFLDAFCYDGLFGIRAALEGARAVVCLDQSEGALERARRNAERNGVLERVQFERVDVMRELKQREDFLRRFEVVVVDPPAFAKNKSELEGAERGYRELNTRALALVANGGLLVSASCSYAMRPELFLNVLAQAAHASGRSAYLEQLRGASDDHPHLLTLPESNYLKCAFLRVRD